MATHSSILAWRIPWTKEPGQPIVCQKESDTIERLTHTHTHKRSNFRSIIDIFIALYSTTQERKGNFSQASLLG